MKKYGNNVVVVVLSEWPFIIISSSSTQNNTNKWLHIIICNKLMIRIHLEE